MVAPVSEKELRNFLNEMHDSDMVRGLFMVFDNVLKGCTISESNFFSRDDETQEIKMNVGLKVASISSGMFHIAKYNGNDEIYFIVGNILGETDTSTGYTLENLIDFVLEDNYYVEMDFDDDFDDEVINDGVSIFNWNKIVDCLKSEKLLQDSLKKISNTICSHQSFLLEYGDANGYVGLGADVLESGDYTDKNLELLFGEFVRFIDKNIVPKLNT